MQGIDDKAAKRVLGSCLVADVSDVIEWNSRVGVVEVRVEATNLVYYIVLETGRADIIAE